MEKPDEIPNNLWDGIIDMLSDAIHQCEPDFVSKELVDMVKDVSDDRIKKVIEQCIAICGESIFGKEDKKSGN